MRKGDKGQQSPFKAGLIAERRQLRKRVQVNLMSLIAATKVTEEEEEEKIQTVTEAKIKPNNIFVFAGPSVSMCKLRDPCLCDQYVVSDRGHYLCFC